MGQCIEAFEKLLSEARGDRLVAYQHPRLKKSSISTDIEALHMSNKVQLLAQ